MNLLKTRLASVDDKKFLIEAYHSDHRISWPYLLSTSFVGVLYIVFPLAMTAFAFATTTEELEWTMPMKSLYDRFFFYFSKQ